MILFLDPNYSMDGSVQLVPPKVAKPAGAFVGIARTTKRYNIKKSESWGQ